MERIVMKLNPSYCLTMQKIKMLIGGERKKNAWRGYLEESRESRFRLASRFYRLPRGLPIIKEKGICLQDDWLSELQKSEE